MRKNPFKVFDYEEYLDFVIDFIERLSPDIVLQRLFAMLQRIFSLHQSGITQNSKF